ncbi:MAG: VCBS repeat-containing protein [Planctomycetota bacterium]
MLKLACPLFLLLPVVAQSPFRTTRHAGLPTIYTGDKFASGDLDGDGDVDLFVANDNSANQLLRNDGSGRFTDATAGHFVMQPGSNATHSVDLADIDGDGDLDILIGNDDYLSNRVYLNNGTGVFTDVTATALPPNAHFTECQVVADFDGDGDVDWFTVDGGPCHFYENNGNGVFTDATATRIAGLPAIDGDRFDVTPFAADIDSDGDLDVMVPQFLAAPYLIRNQGGVLGPNQGQLAVAAPSPGNWFTDVDGDGDPDVFASGGRYLLQNQGNGTFVDVTATAFGTVPSGALGCFDIDNDGDDDLVTTSRIWTNNGLGVFTAQLVTTSLAYGFNAGRAAADFDGDGDIDLPGRPNFLRQVFAATAPVRGGSYLLECHARPGAPSLIAACCATGTGIVPVPGFGLLRLDPLSAQVCGLGIVTSPLALTWNVPNLPAIAGAEVHFQSCVIDALDGNVITNVIRDVVQ